MKRSAVWNHFTISSLDDRLAVCQLCGLCVSRGGKDNRSHSTSNLRSHLRSKHPEVLACTNNEGELASASSAVLQLPVSPSLEFVATVTHGRNDKKKLQIDQRIAEMICLDKLPFDFVERIGFCRLLQHLDPKYEVPTERCFRTTLIPDLAERMRARVSERLKQVEVQGATFSLTTEIWSSVSGDYFANLTCHFVQGFKRHSVTVNVSQLSKPINEDIVASKVREMIETCDMEESNLFKIIHDNSVNLRAAFARTELPSSGCLNHALQLVIIKGCLEVPEVKNMLQNCRSFISYFMTTPAAAHQLHSLRRRHGIQQQRLILDSSVRWDSTLKMLATLLEHKPVILEYEADQSLSKRLSKSQWRLMDKLVDILSAFKDALTKINESKSFLSEVFPTIKSLSKLIRRICHGDGNGAGVKILKEHLLNYLSTILQMHIEDEQLLLATITDPRFKLKGFMESWHQERAEELLRQSIYESLKEKSKSCSSEPLSKRRRIHGHALWSNLSDSESESDQEIQSHEKEEQTELIEDVQIKQEAVGVDDKVSEAVQCYLSEPRIDENDDLFDYWLAHAKIHPLIFEVAQKALCCPSSLSEEISFDTTLSNDDISIKKTQLDTDHLKEIILLSKNLPFFDFNC